MMYKLFYTLGVLALIMVALAAKPLNAQTTANGPYYATPSWDQKLQCDTQATCPRFIVLSNWNNEAVLDRETGLVWQPSPFSSEATWSQAHDLCNKLSVTNRLGWRLPTVQELASLVDDSRSSFPRVPLGAPFSFPNVSRYWSATTTAADTNVAFVANFGNPDDGTILSNLKTGLDGVFCVRGGQGVDPQ